MPDSPVQLDKKILDRGYWIATHRLTIKRWTVIGLYLAIAAAYLVFFIQFGVYTYRFGDWDELMKQAQQPLYGWGAVHEDRAPLDLEVGQTFVFPVGDNRYDFAVEVYNPNKQWAVESLQYHFTYGDTQKTTQQSAFILPGEQKYLTLYSFYSETPIVTAAKLEHFDYRWKKFARLPELSWIYLEQPRYTARQTVVERGQQRVFPPHVSWVVQNGSTLNIRKVVWQVGMYNGGRLVGVASYQAENFVFLEERRIDLNVPETGAVVDSVKVYPIVNIFDPGFTYLR